MSTEKENVPTWPLAVRIFPDLSKLADAGKALIDAGRALDVGNSVLVRNHTADAFEAMKSVHENLRTLYHDSGHIEVPSGPHGTSQMQRMYVQEKAAGRAPEGA